MLLQVAGTIRHTVCVLPTVTLALSRHTFSSEAAAATTTSHYEVLGVDRAAAPTDIKKAFRQRAKALHPDLNSQLSQSDAEAFLRLVAAYEVLSDAEQRLLYDAATDPQLPHMLRRAAAAQQQQQADAAAGQAMECETDASLNWRWGMADWARYGPSNASDAPTSTDDGAAADGALDLRLSVLTALRRHQRDLEVELHSALMTAFLGPRLELQAGELPSSLELDERSNPTLTDDLLHLVHGRTLLGVVQLPRTLRLEGASERPLQLPSNSSSRVAQPPRHPPAASAANTSNSDTDIHPADVRQLHQTVDSAADVAAQQHKQYQQPAQQLQQQRHHEVGSQQQHWKQQAQSGVLAQAIESCPAAQQHPASSEAVQGEPAGAPQVMQGTATAGATDASSTAAAGAAAGQAGSANAAASAEAAAAAADPAAAAPDAEIGDAEWRQLLLQQHPLLGSYDWRVVPAAAASSDAAGAAEQHQGEGDPVLPSTQAGHVTHGGAGMVAVSLPAHDSSRYEQQQQQQQQEERDQHSEKKSQEVEAAAAAAADAGFGGKAAREAWEQRNEGLAHAADSVGELRPPVDMPRLSEEDLTFIAEYESRVQTGKLPAFSWWGVGRSAVGPETVQQQQEWQGKQGQNRESWQQQWNQLDAAGQVEVQQEWHRQWQQQQEQRQQAKQEWQDMQQQTEHAHQHHSGADDQQQQQATSEHLQHQHSRQHEHEQQQRQAAPRRPRSGHRRLWRWLRTPSPDWLAADWSFTDESEGVVVLRLLQEGSVSAVAVRDDTQDNKPIKVYVDGVLYAAVLEDVVLQPLTGKLMAVLYRFYTPGVHHLFFYLPNTPGASRVLAKMLRRWMPPSSTWLFPPRANSHDRCSWLLEWEGFGTQHRPGWMHPAVYVLTSAYYTYDIEARSLSRKLGPYQQWFKSLSGHAKVAVAQAWTACRELMQRLQLVVSR